MALDLDIVATQEARAAIKLLSEFQKFRINFLGSKVFIGNDAPEGFSAPVPFYLFWCEVCERHTKDYPHGSIERQYLNCAHCRARINFHAWWMPFIERWYQIKFKMKFIFDKPRV